MFQMIKRRNSKFEKNIRDFHPVEKSPSKTWKKISHALQMILINLFYKKEKKSYEHFPKIR